jgi:hypothetical protein
VGDHYRVIEGRFPLETLSDQCEHLAGHARQNTSLIISSPNRMLTGSVSLNLYSVRGVGPASTRRPGHDKRAYPTAWVG